MCLALDSVPGLPGLNCRNRKHVFLDSLYDRIIWKHALYRHVRSDCHDSRQSKQYVFPQECFSVQWGKDRNLYLVGRTDRVDWKRDHVAGFQKSLSIFLGILLLIIAVFSINVEAKLLRVPYIDQFVFFLKSAIGRWLKRNHFSGSFFVGLLNGLLPCGLVYMAMAGALGTGEWWSGMMYMALFGLGTLPLMTITILAGSMAGMRIRVFMKRIYPVFLVVFAMLFLFRGLNFHLPADFFFWEKMQDWPMCH